MIWNILLIIIGFILLIKGADFLVDGASDIAKKFHISEIIIGLTIVSIGTSMPELVVSVSSSIKGLSDIAIGNVIGSNISNLLLILGVCAMIKNLKYQKQTKFIENPISIFTTILFFLLCINSKDYTITRIEGVILLIFCLAFIGYNVYMAIKGEEKNNIINKIATRKISIPKSMFFIAIGIIALKYGGDFVVNNASEIASKIGISDKLISLTIVAVGTSLPELITSITATIKGDTDMAIGNILGSQIFNILLIIGLSAVVNPLSYSVSYNKEMILLLCGTILMFAYPFIGKKNYMTRNNGIIFAVTYAIYTIFLILTSI